MITLVLRPHGLQFFSIDAAQAPVALTGIVPMSASALVQSALRQSPPTAAGIEAAIEQVEEAVMPLHAQVQGAGAELRVDGAQPLLPWLPSHANLDVLEALFHRAVAVASGRPVAADPALADAETVALLVILREVAHHLNFGAVDVDQAGTAGLASILSSTFR